MSAFIEHLEKLNASDTRVRAVLRRSLAFDLGCYPPAYPFVEPFMRDDIGSWRREVFYLVAGLWALHWRQGRSPETVSLARACAAHQAASGSTSTERRFIALLDSERDQLTHRLRQTVALLNDQPIDFDDLLGGLLFWNDVGKRTQTRWARDFYRNLRNEDDSESDKREEAEQ